MLLFSKVIHSGKWLIVMIALRDTNGNLCSKDILDVNMDMSVAKSGSNFEVKANQNYTLDETFDNKEEAEEQIRALTASRNHAEEVLQNEGV